MAGESIDRVGQSAGTMQAQAGRASVAETMLARHTGPDGLDTTALAAEVRANPEAGTALVSELEAQMTPVERGRFAAALDASDGVVTLAPAVVTAQRPSEEGVGAFIEGAVMGDFGDNSSWSATAGQVAMGFVPIAGQIADARDTAAAVGQIWNGEEGGWRNLGAAAVGWIPGIGDAAKGAIRGGERLTDATGEIAQTAARRGDEAAEAARERIVMDGGRRGDWPTELNARDLKPNTDYVVNGYTYRTDASGRVNNVEGRLDLKTADRNGYQQGVSGRADRLPDDQGGHLIASIFNGAGDRVNLVPMNGNFNMGAWRRLEDRFADAIKDGKQVDVKIDVIYGSDGARPDRFRVQYSIDGEIRTQSFLNRAGG